MPAPGQHVFSEKVALVTGATTPVGRAVSMQLGLYGCFVIAAHKPAPARDTDPIRELRSLGTLAHSFEADPSSSEGAAQLIGNVGDVYGRLDILVNCPEETLVASKDGAGSFGDAIEALFAPYYFLTEASLKLFKGRPKPRIVNVVRYAPGDEPLISALNAAVKDLSRTYSSALPANYRVNVISVREDRARESSEETLDPELFRPPAAVDPDDVARAVLFLLSSEAKGVNGQVLEIG